MSAARAGSHAGEYPGAGPQLESDQPADDFYYLRNAVPVWLLGTKIGLPFELIVCPLST
jgi:hypothetical protein